MRYVNSERAIGQGWVNVVVMRPEKEVKSDAKDDESIDRLRP